jgi:hypothetical protein
MLQYIEDEIVCAEVDQSTDDAKDGVHSSSIKCDGIASRSSGDK